VPLTAPNYGQVVRLLFSSLLAACCLLGLAASANGGSEYRERLIFREVGLDGHKRLLSRHDISPYTSSLSPDYKEFAYIAQQCVGCPGNPVMVADVRSPRERVLVESRTWYGVSWAPNGRQLALNGGTDVQSGLWLVNADGSDLHHVANTGHLTWSPDSKSLASSRPISVLSLETGQERYLSQGYGPAWSPDGTRIAFTHNSVIDVASVRTGDVRRLARGVGPSWSPDGRRIAFIRYMRDAYHISLWVISTRGGKPRRIARGLSPGAPLIWSPKGRQIAFNRGDGLFAKRPDGDRARLLARENRAIVPLAWSRDGRRVLYSALIRSNE